MGTIRQLATPHFEQYPEERNIISAFLPLFYVTWAKRMKKFNTELSVFLLSPENETKKYFGFLHELLLVYAPFSQLQDRTMKAVEQIFLEDPARGRVETFSWIIITKQTDAEYWFSDYCASNGITKTIISLYEGDVLNNQNNREYIKDVLTKHLFVKDWFDKSLPLKTEETFFGRVDLLNEIRQGIRSGENIGLFGLRKTGKTSIIYRIRETFSNENIVLVYDCRQPRYRNKHWLDLLNMITKDIILESGFRGKICDDLKRSDDVFFDLMKKISRKKPILLIFDEFEFISNIAKNDAHWNVEFLDLWQTLQAVQNETGNISFIIAGVNPYSIEESTIRGEQNPLFNIFRIHYVTGFNSNNTRSMVQIIGRRMGLVFDDQFCDMLYRLFGGHPLLCRIACSVIHKKLFADAAIRPFVVNAGFLDDPSLMEEINYKIEIYCKDILNPLREFYNSEYDMLTFLATDDIVSFMELAKDSSLTGHLKKYGILDYKDNSRPFIKIAALKLLIAKDYQHRNHLPVPRYIVPHEKRLFWLEERQRQIDWFWKRIRILAKEKNMPQLSTNSDLPKASKFFSMKPVENIDDYVVFINTMNICFVESIENFGKGHGKKDYFWNEIQFSYKTLFHALLRIKTYRNASDHSELNEKFKKFYDNFLEEDFDKKDFHYFEDGFYICQQVVLDALVEAFMIEVGGLEE